MFTSHPVVLQLHSTCPKLSNSQQIILKGKEHKCVFVDDMHLLFY